MKRNILFYSIAFSVCFASTALMSCGNGNGSASSDNATAVAEEGTPAQPASEIHEASTDSKEIITKEYAMTEFESIVAAGNLNVTVVQGSGNGISVTGRACDISNNMKCAIDDKSLNISNSGVNIKPIDVIIYASDIQSLSAQAGTKMTCDRANATTGLHLSASSGASLKMSLALSSGDMSVEASSGGSIEISSLKCDKCHINASSGSSITAEVNCKKVDANASSGAVCTVNGIANSSTRNSSSGGKVRMYL